MLPKIKGNLMLSPMVGVTDIAFRILCRRHGADFASIEMTAADAVLHKNDIVQFSKEDRPVALQLMGTDPSSIVKAGKKYQEEIDVLDINMGCPSKTVTKIGAGSALMTKPELIRKIVRECTKNLSVPVTVKMRAGYDSNSLNVLDIAKICEQEGASAITVHGRTKTQGYRGLADWGVIKEVKDNLGIPVIGNGDIKKPEDALRMVEKTGCDFVMIGRAAMHCPMIFENIKSLRDKGSYIQPSKKEKIDLVYEYLDLAEEFNIKFPRIKSNVHNLTSGIPGGKKFRLAINSMKDTASMIKELEKII